MEKLNIKHSGKGKNTKSFIHKYSAILLVIIFSGYTIAADFTKKNYFLNNFKNQIILHVSDLSIKFLDFTQFTKEKASALKATLEKKSNEDELFSYKKENHLKSILLKELERENSSLKNLMSFASNFPRRNYITAKVINTLSKDGAYFAFINAGSQNGVKVNRIVINEYGLVGRIVHTEDNYAKISLLTDKNFRIAVFAENKFIKGVAAGTGRKKMKLLYSPAVVAPGTKIVTLGEDCFSPPGIILGYSDENGEISPSFSDDILEFISIVEDECYAQE